MLKAYLVLQTQIPFQSQNGLILVGTQLRSFWPGSGFQSQNGLILVNNYHRITPLLFQFQSQNGLILVIFTCPAPSICPIISIPKWSDFSKRYTVKGTLEKLDFNPKMV